MKHVILEGRGNFGPGRKSSACRDVFAAVATLALLLAGGSGKAGTLYMDQNGSTSGFGGGGTALASSSIWSASSTGTATPGGWASNSDLIFNPNATTILDLGTGRTANSLNLNATYRIVSFLNWNKLTLSSGRITVNSGSTFNVRAALSGTQGLTKLGTGKVVLGTQAYPNDYSGVTAISAGSIELEYNDELPDGSSVTIDGGSLRLQANSDTVSTVTLKGGSIQGTTGVLTTTGSFQMWDGRISAALAGSGKSLVKSTGGTVTLAGTNTYSGSTTVADGTLLVDGALATGSAVTVQTGGTLGGSGTIGGPVTVQDGGYLSPGTEGSGTLTTGTLALEDGSVLEFGLGALADPGDKIAISGDLSLGGTLNITDLGGLEAGRYTLMTYTGALTGNGLSLGVYPPNRPCLIGTAGATNGEVFLVVKAPGTVVTVR